jgi:2-polyprenyl-3-methyl-5-hydroxy-6-metoxy-1,4-benzoquinol methylase
MRSSRGEAITARYPERAVEDRYYLELGAAFARGRLGERLAETDAETFEVGRTRGLKMHKFKRNAELPRVRRVLSLLAGLAPESLLDIGSGRGTFLWPLLDTFPSLDVTAIDRDDQRASDLACVTKGGIARLRAAKMDAAALDFPDGAFDGVTILEVLEHLEAPERAAREAMRVAKRFVVASVPSKPDDNPEHIHLFDVRALAALFTGARSVKIEHVLNHAVALVLV